MFHCSTYMLWCLHWRKLIIVQCSYQESSWAIIFLTAVGAHHGLSSQDCHLLVETTPAATLQTLQIILVGMEKKLKTGGVTHSLIRKHTKNLSAILLSTFSTPATRCCLIKSIISVFRWSICPHDYWWCFIHNKPDTLHSAGATLHTFCEFCFECTIKTVYELFCLFLDKWSHLLVEFISFTQRNIHAFLWQWRNWFF